MVSFPQVSPPEPRIRLPSTPYALHVQPISFFSILSPEQHWVKIKTKYVKVNCKHYFMQATNTRKNVLQKVAGIKAVLVHLKKKGGGAISAPNRRKPGVRTKLKFSSSSMRLCLCFGT